MKTGTLLFDVELADYKLGYSATVAPLVVKDKVIVGIAGAELRHPRLHRRLRRADRQDARGASTPSPDPDDAVGAQPWPQGTTPTSAAADRSG